jgi:hypothetical protein
MKNLLFLTFFLLSLFVSTVFALEPGDTLWTRTYGGSEYDAAHEVEMTTDGGYIMVGRSKSFGAGDYDFYLVKTDPNGDTLWTRAYGGAEEDRGYSVKQTGDGGYIVFGWTMSFGAGSADFWLLKTDAEGDTLWTRTYGGSDDEYGQRVELTRDGGYILAGNTISFGVGSWDVYVVRTDDSGDTLWTRTYGGSGADYGWSVRQTTDGGYIIGGYTSSFGAGGRDLYLIKTDANGNTAWTRTYGGSADDLGYSAEQTGDGGYIFLGYTASFGAGYDDYYLVKTDPNGNTLWTRTYGEYNSDIGHNVEQTADGGYILVGNASSFGAGGQDIWLIKTDANGDSLWSRTHGGDRSDYGYSVHQTTDGGYIVGGFTYSFGAGSVDFYLLRIAGEAPQPDVSIEIVPDDPPVTVPQGGSFGFTGSLTNNTEDRRVADVWIMASGPEKGVYGPFKEFENIPLAPSQSRSRHLTQGVPNAAPLGSYNYIAYCGDYPSTVMDSSYFQIEVVAGPAASSGEDAWVLTGSFDRNDELSGPLPHFAFLSNYPNPFNGRTVISYELPLSGHVKLEVYNLLGGRVATLVDAHQSNGHKSVRWDASEVSSGVYFYKLTAGDFSAVKRMILLR